MKLRSGKVLLSPEKRKKELPMVLQTKLADDVKSFKKLLIGHEEFAKNLLEFIAEAHSFDTVYKVTNILRDAGIPDEDRDLGATCGSLVGLVIGNHNFYPDHNIAHIYHDEIKGKMLNAFDGDISLTGNQDDMEI